MNTQLETSELDEKEVEVKGPAMRVTLYIFGREQKGAWRVYDLSAMLRDCETFARNNCAFTMEFRNMRD